MKRLILVVMMLAAFALVATGCEAATENSGSLTEADAGDGMADILDEEPDEPAEPEPEPDGNYNLNCDYLLGDGYEAEGTEDGYRFVAGGSVENTGNIGTVVEVKATWQLLGTDPVVDKRRVRLRPGQTENVQMTVIATSDQIDAHQSADSKCDADASILKTFGRPQ